MEGDRKRSVWAVEYPDGRWRELSRSGDVGGVPSLALGFSAASRREFELLLAARGLRVGSRSRKAPGVWELEAL